jgi:hypothetical protein
MHKYLTNAKVKESEMPWNWRPDDKRQEKWKKEREEYGFDERETWSLDYTFRLWFYERLKMYNDINKIDTNYHNFEYKKETYTLQQCIDFILSTFEETFKDDMWDFKKEIKDKVFKAYALISLIMPWLWW